MNYYRLNPTPEQRKETYRANYRNKLVKDKKKFNQQTFWQYVEKYSGYLDYEDRLAIALQVINS